MTKPQEVDHTISQQLFIKEFCDMCKKPPNNEICGHAFKNIVIPPQCPPSLITTHFVCPMCAGVISKDTDHTKSCLFQLAGFKLHVGGWSTSTSNLILKTLRNNRTVYRNPISNWIRSILAPHIVDETIIIPVPIGLKLDGAWSGILKAVTNSLSSTTILSAIFREKQRSTRTAAAAQRAQIAMTEYHLDTTVKDSLTGRNIILIDDNVTSGHTLLHCASLIRTCNPQSLSLVALERYVSPRIIQRCTIPSPFICLGYVPKTSRV